jgi:hypothetical protein
MNEKTKAFVDDLFAVMDKHGVLLDCYYDDVEFVSYELDEEKNWQICIEALEIETEWFRRWNEKETARKIEAQKLKMSKKHE